MGRKPEQVEAEAQLLGLTIRPDWANRPALSVDEARALTSGEARPDHDHQIGWARHLAECKDWRAARDQSARDAARKIRDQAGRGVSAGCGRRGGQAGRHRCRQTLRTHRAEAQVQRHHCPPLEYITREEARMIEYGAELAAGLSHPAGGVPVLSTTPA